MTLSETNNDLLEEIEEDAQKDKYLLFELDKVFYGLDIRCVTEIVMLPEVTAVPDMPDSIIGVINLRGRVISVIDARKRFKLNDRAYDERTCLIVVDLDGLLVGVIVDGVNEVVMIPESQIDPPPRNYSGIKNSYVKGIGKMEGNVSIILNIEKILYEEELTEIQKAG